MSQAVTEVEDEFLGLDRTECCIECQPSRCIITGDGVCGHPKKSGLQVTHKANPETVKRFNQARNYIAMQEVRQRDFEE
jgi:hypothetical protein